LNPTAEKLKIDPHRATARGARGDQLPFLLRRAVFLAYTLPKLVRVMNHFLYKTRSRCHSPLAGFFVCASAVIGLAQTPDRTAKIDFNRDIRPIFSEHCYACHGPDEQKRKAGLRLDVQEDAFKELKSGNHALVAGNPAGSAMVTRITSTDSDEVMPPPKHNKPLKP